ncbi:hypothetical protein RIF29_39355 [Crotalaria pallida]|uniref:Uncharacterized protein n=1 Tax=Crotalaria pallida TaxID=3830 RepID=A0AAN9HQM1_CROPI
MVLFISLLIITCISLSSSFAYLFFSSSPLPSSSNFARPLTKLQRPIVLLISSDGFRFGYQFKTPTLNHHRLISNGTEAFPGLIPVFPTLTFLNHYSIDLFSTTLTRCPSPKADAVAQQPPPTDPTATEIRDPWKKAKPVALI